MWTNEQLQEALREVSADLDKLSNSEKPLTKEEGKYRKKLLMRKYVLDKIKEAKERTRKVMNFIIPRSMVYWYRGGKTTQS